MDADKRTALRWFRIAVGFLIAPLVGGFAMGLALMGPTINWPTLSGLALFIAAICGYPATLLIALPAFLALKRRLAFTPLSSSLAGAAVGTVPMLVVLGFAAATEARGAPADAGGYVFLLVAAAAAGLVGGLAFRLIAGPLAPPLRRQRAS